MPTDPRFLAADGLEVFTGNELLVKGCLETPGGVNLITGYPGSPVAGFFDCLGDVAELLNQHGIHAFQANNEALASAAVNGSQMLPCRSVVAFKSVGLHVAADALALGTLAGAHPEGGAVAICGEDPWCESTQVPADSRFLLQHLRMPVIEPGGPQQLKDWIALCFELSRRSGLYVGYVVTVAQADGGGSVRCRPNCFPQLNTRQKLELVTRNIDLDKVLLPPRTWQHELGLDQRFAQLLAAARELGLNRIVPAAEPMADGPAPLGFVVTGMGGPYLEHLLADLGLAGRFPLLQMGLSYPVDTQLLREFAGLCRHMVVIEERRSFLEMNLRDALFRELPHDQAVDLAGCLYGKRFPGDREGIPAVRGLNYSVLAQRVIPLLQNTAEIPEHLRNGRLSAELARLRAVSQADLAVLGSPPPPRTPTFCPGCPHRDSAAVLLELRRNLADAAYMQRRHNLPPVDLVSHGDTGCYTMLMFPPTEQLMHNYSGMGLGAGTGAGIDPFISNKQLVFMGDGTFFHSGQTAISNSVKAGQDITYIILENGTTAMTGHQDHAGVPRDMFGREHPIVDIANVVAGMARTAPIRLYKADPADRTAYMAVLEEALLAPGVKVVIAVKECGITRQRRLLAEERQVIRKTGFLPRKTHMNITPEVCEHCLECTKQTACPGLTFIETDYGPKVDTDLTWCVNDGACERVRVSGEGGTHIKPCPSFEQVTLVHSRRRRYLLPRLSLDKLPDPERYVHGLSAPGAAWRCHMSGVGGMGIGTVAAILVRAGHKAGYRVVFQERKGLAIRNGGVFAQITLVNDAGAAAGPTGGVLYPTTGSIPYGRADLLLGIDILEAARAVDPRGDFRVAAPDRTSAVLNLHRQPTVPALLGRDDFDPAIMQQRIMAQCAAEHSFARNLAELCEQRLGSKQFVNIMMLGVAFQLGLIPVSAHAIAWAIKDTIRREHRRNLKAFNIGRKLALEPRVLPAKPEPRTWEQLLTNKTKVLRRTRRRGPRLAAALEKLVHTAMRLMPDLPESARYDLTLRIYDILQYQDERLARRYIHLLRGIYRRDSAARGRQATLAAIWNLAKVILIKDEVYVSYLLTRFEKKQRDILKFGVDVANGDRLIYRHHTRPEVSLGRWRLRLNITTHDWMLRLVARCKFVRHLPGWHRREAAFRDWYIDLLDHLDLASDTGYARALEALRCPEEVCGYREIRYPRMDAARQRIDRLLARQPETAAPQGTLSVAGARRAGGSCSMYEARC